MLAPVRLKKLCHTLKNGAPAAERLRRLPDRSLAALTQAGIFRSLVPRRYGGTEIPLSLLFETLLEAGRCCCSSAWVGSLLAVHSVIAAWFTEEAQARVWADGPDALIASSFAPMGSLEEKEGGALLSGHWSFASGVDHAHWLILGARRQGRPVLVLAPRSEVQIKDDWKVIGLAGSGSKSLSVEDCWVPEDLILDLAAVESGETPGSRLNKAALFHLPWRPLFSYAFIPPILGATLASVDEAHLYFKGRKSAFTDQAFRERPLAWYAMAQSRGEFDNALTLMRQDLAELEDATARQALTRDLVLRASFRPALIAKLCRSSVDRLFHASGGSALYDSHPLQSLFRDIQAMTQHPAVNYEIACETYGRALME